MLWGKKHNTVISICKQGISTWGITAANICIPCLLLYIHQNKISFQLLECCQVIDLRKMCKGGWITNQPFYRWWHWSTRKLNALARGGSTFSYSYFQFSPLSFALPKRPFYVGPGLCFQKLWKFIILYALLILGYGDFFPMYSQADANILYLHALFGD